VKLPKPSALAEMMAAEFAEKEFGVRGEMLPPNPQIFPAVTVGWRPPPPDWEQERIERLAAEQERERQERAKIVEQELARIAPEDQEPEATPKKRGWQRQKATP
jgi:hypothetical protein